MGNYKGARYNTLIYDKKHEISWHTLTYKSLYILFIRFDILLDTACINETSARDKMYDTLHARGGACFNYYHFKTNRR